MLSQIPRWVDRLRRTGGMKGPGEASVLEDLQPTIQLDDLSLTPFKWLGRDRVWIAEFNETSPAGGFGAITLGFNSAPSAFLLWIRRVHLCTDVATNITFSLNDILAGPVVQNVFSRDTRESELVLPAAGIITCLTFQPGVAVAAANVFARTRLDTNTCQTLDLDLVLHADALANSMTIQQAGVGVLSLRGYFQFELLNREASEA